METFFCSSCGGEMFASDIDDVVKIYGAFTGECIVCLEERLEEEGTLKVDWIE